MATVDFTTIPEMLVVPPQAVTLNGFRAWVESDSFPDRGRVTFIRGRSLIDTSPERYETHLKLKEVMSRVVGTLVVDGDLGDFYVDGGFLTNPAADISNEPDAMFASWRTLQSGKLAPPSDRPQDGKHIELVGTPDWVCEIVSDASVQRDAKHLRDAYHRAGIAEYWLVDARGEQIDFQLLVWSPSGYESAEPAQDWLVSPVFSRRFRLVRSHDRLNRWAYDLQHEPVT